MFLTTIDPKTIKLLENPPIMKTVPKTSLFEIILNDPF